MKSALPKVMHRVAGRPMVLHVIGTLGELAPQKVAVVVGPDMAQREVTQALLDLSMGRSEERPSELGRLRERIERNLSGLLGPQMAQLENCENRRPSRARRSSASCTLSWRSTRSPRPSCWSWAR